MRRTATRHRLLAEVKAGRMSIYRGLQWSMVRDGEFLRGQQQRVAESLRDYVRTAADRRNVAERALLTPAGARLLADWDERYGATEIKEETT